MSVDIVSFGETMLRLTASSGTRLETTPTLHVFVAGSETNTLASLARLHLNVSWLSALPENPLGKHVETELRRHGIDTSHIIWEKAASRLGIFYAEEAPAPLGLQVHYDRAYSACALIDPESVDYTLVDQARVLHLTGITPALSANAGKVCKRFLQRARSKQVPLSFDVNYRAKLWSHSEAATHLEEFCQQASILFCARADATELWGFTGNPQEILQQMAQRFSNKKEPAKRIVLTLGSEGSAELYDDQYTHEPAFVTEGNARFGSGDAFDAGYLYSYLHGSLYQELHSAYGVHALAFGNALAALKRCIQGDIATITLADVKALLQKEENRRFR